VKHHKSIANRAKIGGRVHFHFPKENRVKCTVRLEPDSFSGRMQAWYIEMVHADAEVRAPRPLPMGSARALACRQPAPSPVGVARPTPPNGSTFPTPPARPSGWGQLSTTCPAFHPVPGISQTGKCALARRGATSFCFLPPFGKIAGKKQHLFGASNAFEGEGSLTRFPKRRKGRQKSSGIDFRLLYRCPYNGNTDYGTKS